MSDFTNTPKKSSGGCGRACAVGCVTLIVLAVSSGILLYLGGPKLLRMATDRYTSTAPASLPIVDVSDEEAANLSRRVEAFAQALQAGESGKELALSSKDLNVLIQRNPSYGEHAAKVYVTLEGDAIRGDASLPLDGLGQAFKGRWLNGSGTFHVETAAGRLLVFMDTLSVRGKPLPDSFMAGLRGKNLAEQAANDAKTVELLSKVERLYVRDGTLHIVSK